MAERPLQRTDPIGVFIGLFVLIAHVTKRYVVLKIFVVIKHFKI